MDKTDEALIAALREDARASLSDLAAALSLSRTTVRARLARLRTKRRNPWLYGRHPVGCAGRSGARADDDRDRGAWHRTDHPDAEGMAQLRAVHSTNGRWDVIVEIGTATLEDFDAVLARIRKLDGVVASETSLLLKTRKTGQGARVA